MLSTTGYERIEETEDPEKAFEGVEVRRDFRETAFFYPSLKTDENGDVEIAFTIPESLTKSPSESGPHQLAETRH